MTEKQLRNKLRALERELELLVSYEMSIVSEMGRRRYEKELDSRLEQYKKHLIALKKMTDEKD